jgi:DNA-binding XRE family transcriptional regulator
MPTKKTNTRISDAAALVLSGTHTQAAAAAELKVSRQAVSIRLKRMGVAENRRRPPLPPRPRQWKRNGKPGVTAAGQACGRKRKSPPPRNPFARWLASQKRTVAELAIELGISVSSIYSLRNGRGPSLAVAKRIAEVSMGAVPMDVWKIGG